MQKVARPAHRDVVQLGMPAKQAHDTEPYIRELLTLRKIKQLRFDFISWMQLQGFPENA